MCSSWNFIFERMTENKHYVNDKRNNNDNGIVEMILNNS